LSPTQAPPPDGLSVVTPLQLSCGLDDTHRPPYTVTAPAAADDTGLTAAAESPYPPPFSSLYFPPEPADEDGTQACEQAAQSDSPPAFAPAPPFTESSSSAAANAVAETKAALPRDPKDASSRKDIDDGEPPPPYSEGFSPLESFSYVMASAGGPASIITQVSQHSGGGPPINTLGGSDENITLELRFDSEEFSLCAHD
jgi:ATP-binding cassette subfamily F protein 3